MSRCDPRPSAPSSDDDYIARMIENAEMVDGILVPTEIQVMTDVYDTLGKGNKVEDSEDRDSEIDDGDEVALHGMGWMFWNMLGVIGVAVVAWVVYTYRR
ncbi:hypothetical protein DE146DRAFT_758764 [Phaeosphaeria sp. MPI-PUGE-AT-0046c]|nr:hypothetical protein DE146DRAFT_758764 [Phaeosphaeria sp. MPI-PUGE-AT-0046c]